MNLCRIAGLVEFQEEKHPGLGCKFECSCEKPGVDKKLGDSAMNMIDGHKLLNVPYVYMHSREHQKFSACRTTCQRAWTVERRVPQRRTGQSGRGWRLRRSRAEDECPETSPQLTAWHQRLVRAHNEHIERASVYIDVDSQGTKERCF